LEGREREREVSGEREREGGREGGRVGKYNAGRWEKTRRRRRREGGGGGRDCAETASRELAIASGNLCRLWSTSLQARQIFPFPI